jgi:RNA polymerase sigma-70 factor (ECF subfamily)
VVSRPAGHGKVRIVRADPMLRVAPSRMPTVHMNSATGAADFRAIRDSELLAQCRVGDRHTFGELVLRHSAVAHRTALAIVRSHADAEDVVQNALLQACTHLNHFRGDASFTTWFIAIVRNQAISHSRTRHFRLRRATTVLPGERTVLKQLVSRERSPEDVVLDGERLLHLSRCIDALPIMLREALRLAQHGDYSYKEMGAIMRVPTGTIKWRVWVAHRIVADRFRRRSACGRVREDQEFEWPSRRSSRRSRKDSEVRHDSSCDRFGRYE